MAGDDGASANIESLNAALAEAEIKAAAGDKMYLVRAKFLREKLASITIPPQQPEPSSLPQSVRMSALNTAHTEAKENYKPEEKSAGKNLGGFSQVTVVSDTSSDNCPTNMSDQLAGASPHAPRRPETQQSSQSKGDKITFRLPEGMKPMFDAKVAAVNSYQSAYIVGLIAADLRIPLDEERLQRDRELQEEIAALTVALNRQGNNINQMAKATHEGKPSPLTRPEISQLLQQHRAAVSAILKLGFG
jgi:DNA-binding protein YbaB